MIFPSSEASAGMEATLFLRRRSHYIFAFSQSSCFHKLRSSARCKQCLTKLFFPKLLKSNLTEMLIVSNAPSRALKHPNAYEISINRSLLDKPPYLFTPSAVPLAPQGPKDYGTCGNGECPHSSLACSTEMFLVKRFRQVKCIYDHVIKILSGSMIDTSYYHLRPSLKCDDFFA